MWDILTKWLEGFYEIWDGFEKLMEMIEENSEQMWLLVSETKKVCDDIFPK